MELRPRVAAVLAVVLVLSLSVVSVGGVASAAPDPGATAPGSAAHRVGTAAEAPAVEASAEPGPTIVRTTTLSLTAGEPGSVEVRVAFDLPDNVNTLVTDLPDDARVSDLDGFERTENDTLRWEDGDGAAPSVTFDLPANRTGTTRQMSTAGSYLFVDAGPWALVEVPSMPVRWLRSGQEVAFDGDVEIDGAGATGGEMAYLGPVEVHTRTAHDQTFRLVVPERVDMAESPDAVLDSLAAASGTLRVGERDDEVVAIVAPEDVDWGARGLSGDDDFWVRESERLDDASNPWLHEYVHTRQSYRATRATAWTTEGIATYYAALLSLRQGLIDFDAFAEHLGRGDDPRFSRGVLVDPGTWGAGSNYFKGALVWGYLDMRTRLETDATRSAADVFNRLNTHDGAVTESVFLSAVGDVGGGDLREAAARYTKTDATPDMWSATRHRRAFDPTPARMSYEPARPAFRVSGPYGNRTAAEPPRIVVNETLHVRAAVTNLGGETGTYAAELAVGGEPVTVDRGTLDPGASVTVSLAHSFSEPGLYEVSVGSLSYQVRVLEPATPTVVGLETARNDDGSVTLTVRLRNDAAHGAGGSLPVVVDGDRVAAVSGTIPPGGEATRTVRLTLSGAGNHTVSVGNRSVTVEVTGTDGTTGGNGDATTDGSLAPGQPGFGPAVAAVALLAALVALRRYGPSN